MGKNESRAYLTRETLDAVNAITDRSRSEYILTERGEAGNSSGFGEDRNKSRHYHKISRT